MPVDPTITARFRRQLGQGHLVLFTGAGFSHDAVSIAGTHVPQVVELKEEFSRLAFPANPHVGAESSLADLFDVAISKAQGSVKNLFQLRLRVSAKDTPERFKTWLSLPWRRHYTLNVDDLDEAIAGHYTLTRGIESISALNHQPIQTNELLSVHLNGRLSDFPNVTFSVRQYGSRLGAPDPWYEMLTTELLSNPVLFVGTQLEEPGLWQHLELRKQRQEGDVELRPPSYLVTPTLPRAREALLKRFNITWVEATEKEFFDDVIVGAEAEAEAGHLEIRRLQQVTTGAQSLHRLRDLIELESTQDLALYLMGRQPDWSDVSSGGYAVTRSFETELAQKARRKGLQLLLLTGTAAAGKSTTAMRLALSLHAEGRQVFVYDTANGSLSAAQVLRATRSNKPEVLLIDDADVFGQATPRLLHDLAELPSRPLVIAVMRNSRLQGLALDDELVGLDQQEVSVPHLVDNDIDLLIGSLERAGRLGRMTGMQPAARRELFREQAGRQLLVAMYYATSGERLEDRVRSECEDLHGASRMAYGMAAIATADNQCVTQSELLLGLGVLGFSGASNRAMNDVRRLASRDLLIHSGRGWQVRHRWIAEKSLEFFKDNGLIHKAVLGITYALASEIDPAGSRHSRERRLLRRWINHDRLKNQTGDVDQCREIYSALQDMLGWEYHYWLQRGSLEVESGDLGQAKNFLESARSLVPHTDFRIENEYAYLTLKRAAQNPHAPESRAEAAAALEDLKVSMESRGKTDTYPFHVFGSQGLGWARRGPLSPAEKRDLLFDLRDWVRKGQALHPKSPDLRRLTDDLEREYLSLATDS